MGKFATQIIRWQEQSGRHDLPWQGTRDPYRIWVSEIMLQQTQVSAVIDYYARFMARFPTLESLATASLDEVMPYWAGLGYYARARNLHKAAVIVHTEHGGHFPRAFADVLALPGIGRSTAAAICAFAYGESRPILDGNVKRVFARRFGVEGDVRAKLVEEEMWRLAEREVPTQDVEAYIQGLMDLGATVCTRSNPTCLLCPLSRDCVAHQQGRTAELPGRGAKREVPHRETVMLVLRHGHEVLLERRPPTGIWGGLWSLPEVAIETDALAHARSRFGVAPTRGRRPKPLNAVDHGFTHYSLTIHPLEISVASVGANAREPGHLWLTIEDALGAAIPAPVKRILLALD
jgi:A/G-specific adenine glycosylase